MSANVARMLEVGSNENATILLEWHQVYNTIYRAKIDYATLIEDQSTEIDPYFPCATRLINFVRWAVEKHPANHYCLILAGHGFGVFNPIIEPKPGPLLNQTENTHLRNDELATALHTIATDLLPGNKLDILGMDACSMAMLEVCHLAEPYVNIFVGSEEIERYPGWHYYSFLKKLTEQPLSPAELATAIVSSFKIFHQSHTTLFTLSAIDLGKLATVVGLFCDIVPRLLNPEIFSVLTTARGRCQQFLISDFIDMYSWYEELGRQAEALPEGVGVLVDESLLALRNCVIANTTGPYHTRAHGISLYFPLDLIDRSYLSSSFCQATGWDLFLQQQRLWCSP